jgi:hypothetical protein
MFESFDLPADLRDHFEYPLADARGSEMAPIRPR